MSIKTWRERCDEHRDHDGIVSDGMIMALMQDEIGELRAALKQAEQAQPVAWVVYDTDNNDIAWSDAGKRLRAETPLYPAQPQRKPLTDEEIEALWQGTSPYYDHKDFARAIEAAHDIKENT